MRKNKAIHTVYVGRQPRRCGVSKKTVHPSFHRLDTGLGMFARNDGRSRNGKHLGRAFGSGILTGTVESSETHPSFNSAHEEDTKMIEINDLDDIYSVAFLVDDRYIVGGGEGRTVRRWRVEDGGEVGTPMDAGNGVLNIAVSQDGKWIVNGLESGKVQVWNAENGVKRMEFKAHSDRVQAVDVSPDSTKIATGSQDKTACVWSLPTGKRFLGPWKHKLGVYAVKYSPNGYFIATATWSHYMTSTVRVYDSQRGFRSFKVSIEVSYSLNQSLAWSSDNKGLFALSPDGNIYCLDASTGSTLSRWPIHDYRTKCITSSSNGAFIAASAGSFISFWDTRTHKQIGSVIKHTAIVGSMAISANNTIVIAGDKKITLRTLYDTLPSSCVSTFPLRIDLLSSNRFIDHRSSQRESG